MLSNTRGRTVFAEKPKALPKDVDHLSFYKSGIVRKKSLGKLSRSQSREPAEGSAPESARQLAKGASPRSPQHDLQRSVSSPKLAANGAPPLPPSMRSPQQARKTSTSPPLSPAATSAALSPQSRPLSDGSPRGVKELLMLRRCASTPRQLQSPTSRSPCSAANCGSPNSGASPSPTKSAASTTPRPASTSPSGGAVAAAVPCLSRMPSPTSAAAAAGGGTSSLSAREPRQLLRKSASGPIGGSPKAKAAPPPLPSFPSEWKAPASATLRPVSSSSEGVAEQPALRPTPKPARERTADELTFQEKQRVEISPEAQAGREIILSAMLGDGEVSSPTRLFQPMRNSWLEEAASPEPRCLQRTSSQPLPSRPSMPRDKRRPRPKNTDVWVPWPPQSPASLKETDNGCGLPQGDAGGGDRSEAEKAHMAVAAQGLLLAAFEEQDLLS
eukprot:TRINITY_DN33640_c0_g1_i1.p1 TRINITY_DN33640_c0_g1~~TRINITY_DN33640_c0_g1_i1.p1  ORF type:complete len:443 (+),score=92.16 TRINITY_DN33640_c0_g1_i1:156-1484(+)